MSSTRQSHDTPLSRRKSPKDKVVGPTRMGKTNEAQFPKANNQLNRSTQNLKQTKNKPSTKGNQDPKGVLVFKNGKATPHERKLLLEKAGSYLPKLSAGVVRKSISLDTVDNPMGQILDLIVLEHALARPNDFESAFHPCASGLKCYLTWALMTAFRKVGNLQTTTMGDVSAWPLFPDEACIPNALFFMIQYHMPYEEFGSRGETKLILNALPTGTNDSIGGGGTGFCCTTTLSQLLVSPITDNAAAEEFSNSGTGSAVVVNISTVQSNWELYSKIISERGCSRKFHELTEVSPDGSAYGYSRNGNGDMVGNPFTRFRQDLCQTFVDNTAASSFGPDNSAMMNGFTIDKSAYPDGIGALSHGGYVKSRNEYVWYCARHEYTGTHFVPYYMGKKLSTFIGTIRPIDLTGFHEMCVELLKYYAATNGLSLAESEVFNFLYVCELALAGRLFNNSPNVFLRGPIIGGKARDVQCAVLPEVADIKLPAVIADYISCLGVVVNSVGKPVYFKPQFETNVKFGWLELSAAGASVAYAAQSSHLVKPFLATTGAIDYSPSTSVTWDSAFVAANPNALFFPQKWMPAIIDTFYGLFTATGMDICVAPDSRLTLGGICTQVYIQLSIVDTTTTTAGVISFQYRTYRKGMSSTYDLAGSEYARAAVYAFNTVATSTGTLYGRFVGRMPSEVSHVDMMKFVFTETIQKQGSFPIEMARLRDKSRQSMLTKLGSTGELVRQHGSEARPILDRLWASAASYLGQVGSKAGEAVVKVGGYAVDILSAVGMKLVESELMAIVGPALFM